MPSSSLVPAGDPTLLFTSAGMVQFKPYFMGEATPPSRRMTTSQKSFRTTDIDEVGDHKHLTFFEMLGNFSIGDYFKKDAVAMAWELVTEKFGLEPDRLYVTIYLDDDEAYHHWRDDIGVPDERIYRYGAKDNWWGPVGKEGPCGPCSEVHYDSGEEFGCGKLVPPAELTAIQLKDEASPLPSCHPNCDCERFVELWNLVFMQFYQDLKGTRTPLPAPSIDTGLGLERMAAVLQGKRNLYETDLFWPIVDRVCQITGKGYGQDADTDYAIRVVAEHSRAVSFLIADGVVPGNEGRGYVLRRIIRRAIRYGRRLGLEEPFLTHIAGSAIDRFQDVYPELSTNRDFIMRIIGLEEERFAQALEWGLRFFQGFRSEIPRIRQDLKNAEYNLQYPGEHTASAVMLFLSPMVGFSWTGPIESYPGPEERAGGEFARNVIVQHLSFDDYSSFESLPVDTLFPKLQPFVEGTVTNINEADSRVPGLVVFRLYDTYGFPPELTAEIAREHGLSVDMEGFEQEMKAQRERARAAHAFHGAMEILPTYENLGVGQVDFVGYDHIQQQSRVVALLVEAAQVGRATKGQSVELVLDTTPFYAESGGQVGDAGVIAGPNGRVRVEDTQTPVARLVVHKGVVEEGDISLGDVVDAQVDHSRRGNTARNHSATHLLHASLRRILGPHVRQAGLLVAPERLRFDYSHVAPLARNELLEVQGLTNQKIQDNLIVTTRESTYTQAVQDGALAFFGDKYGDSVRVVEMGGHGEDDHFSLEVCGGTHIQATGQVGPLFIVSEASVGGGMRRVEAVTGPAAEALFTERSDVLDSLARKLQTPVVDLEARLDSFLEDADRLRKRLATLERESLRREAQDIISRVVDVGGVKVLSARTSAPDADAMREMGDWLKTRLESAVIMLSSMTEGQPMLVAMVTDDLVARGLNAGNIVKEAAQVMGGGGGGRPNLAQAGGRHADKLDDALQSVPDIVRRALVS